MRRLGSLLIGLAVLLVAWVAITALWQEPVTAVKHHQAVGKLKDELHTADAEVLRAPPAKHKVIPARPAGTALGRITGPGIDAIFVSGAGHDDLIKGPGLWHSRPGLGKTSVISGHRTTYGAPFRHIDQPKRGDVIRLTTPWGFFFYRVSHIRIVRPNDVWVARNVGHERLVLTACHPVYSAARRYVVFAERTSTSH